MNSDDLFSAEQKWECLDGELNADSSIAFIEQFKNLFSCKKARASKGAVYVWVTAAQIPRLRGESNIIYFGMTTQSLFNRHYRWAAVEGKDDNWYRYNHIIKKYGPIKVYFSLTPGPKAKETSLLEKYFFDHCEYPPINRTSK